MAISADLRGDNQVASRAIPCLRIDLRNYKAVLNQQAAR